MPSSYKSSRADILAIFLKRAGHEITVVCPEPKNKKDMQNSDYEGIKIIYTPEIQQSSLLSRAKSFFAIRKAMKRVLSESEFDLIRSISLIPGYVSAKLRPECPVMTSLTDFYSDFYLQFNLPAKRMAIPIIKRMERSIMENTDLVVVDTPSQRDEWGKWGLDKTRGVAIPHGIDPARFKSSRKSNKILEKYRLGKSRVLFFHGDISNLDGLDLLAEAAQKLRKEFDIRVMVVGDGRRRYMEFLRQAIRERGLEDIFIFTGWVPYEEIEDYLSCADVFVSPFRLSSTSNTNVTNKILEYFAMSRPVVTTKSLGIDQMFPGCVFYAEPNDPQSLAASIRMALNGQHFKEKIQNASKIPAIYSWKNIVRHEEMVMNALVKNRNRDFQSFDWNLTYLGQDNSFNISKTQERL